jgi:flagellar biosynthetic protein FliR
VLAPLVAKSIPLSPSAVGALAGGGDHEVLIGLMIGGGPADVRQLADHGRRDHLDPDHPGVRPDRQPGPGAAQRTALSTFLAMMGIVLIMTTDLHHLFIGAIVKSYTCSRSPAPVPVADAAALAVQTVAKSFASACSWPRRCWCSRWSSTSPPAWSAG